MQSLVMLENKLLTRQLKRLFHLESTQHWEDQARLQLHSLSALATSDADEKIEEWIQKIAVFLTHIENSYSQYERDLELKERSLQLSSAELSAALNHLQQICIIDNLTQAFNRAYLQDILHKEMCKSNRHPSFLSVILLDIDFFKKVNDTYGHQAGDTVLQELSCRIKKAIRTEDVFGRYGGEEFLVIAPEISLDQAVLLAERLRKTVEEPPMLFETRSIPVTASFGVSSNHKVQVNNWQEVIRWADEALYEAKKQGRNRIVAYPFN
jgi:diguanylate cyclase (GGDEF)-like protein